MNQVILSEILDIAQYEKVRAEFRSRVIALKKRRRLAVGPSITFLFENHETVLSQVQEMMRAERIVDEEAIQHEIDVYNGLLPGPNQLSATMFIELKDAGRIREEIVKFHGINSGEAIYLQIAGERLPADFAAGQSDDHRISAVQYVRFQFTDAQRAAFVKGEAPVELVIDHQNYRHRQTIDGEIRAELARDFAE